MVRRRRRRILTATVSPVKTGGGSPAGGGSSVRWSVGGPDCSVPSNPTLHCQMYNRRPHVQLPSCLHTCMNRGGGVRWGREGGKAAAAVCRSTYRDMLVFGSRPSLIRPPHPHPPGAVLSYTCCRDRSTIGRQRKYVETIFGKKKKL